MAEEKPEQLLGEKVVGTTLVVYLHLLKVKQASSRQVYQELGMSSPYLAEYHLSKLNHLKLVTKETDGLYHVRPTRFGLLNFFVVTGKWMVPRTFFYTLFFLTLGTCLLFTLPEKWNIFSFALMLIPTLVSMVETILFYRSLSRMTER